LGNAPLNFSCNLKLRRKSKELALMAGRLNYEKLNKQKQISRYGYDSALSDISPASNGGRKASIAKAGKKGKNRDARQYAYNFLTTVLDKLVKGDAEPRCCHVNVPEVAGSMIRA
jgi:hypothetical protein